MAMQGMGSAAARDQFSAASKPSKISVGKGSKAPTVPSSNGDTPAVSMTAVRGFGSGSPHSSTMASSAGKAPAAKGMNVVRGFSGGSTLKGKI